MAEQARKIRWPDGVSISTPSMGMWPGIGGTYYFNPGSPSAPRLTLTQRRGMGRGGLRAVFLGNGMTSQDTLGAGATGNAGAGANATVNASIPDIGQPWKMRVSSVEGGVGLPGFAVTQTYTAQQIADWINKYIFPPAMDPQDDELSPFARMLQTKNGSVGANTKPAIPFLSPQEENPLGGGMGDWRASTVRPDVFDTGTSPIPTLPSQPSVSGIPGVIAGVSGIDPTNLTQAMPAAGGLLGLIQQYMRNNPGGGSAP